MSSLPNQALITQALCNKVKALQAVKTLVGMHPTKNMIQVYKNKAPQGATFPLCIVKFLTGPSINGQGGRKLFDKQSWIIKIILVGESEVPAHDALQAIEADFQQSQVNDGTVFAGIRITNPIDYPEDDEGVNYIHLGYQIEIMAYPAPFQVP